MSFPENQAISHVGNLFAGGESKIKTKAVENLVPVDDITLKDVVEGRGIGSLSLAKLSDSGPNLMGKSELQARPNFMDREDAYSIFADVTYGPPPRLVFGPGPCRICGGPHRFSVCAWQYRCPLNADVGEYYKVVCGDCGSDLIDGKCGKKRCSCTCGAASLKNFKLC